MAIDMLIGAAQTLASSTSKIGVSSSGVAGGAAGATSGVASGFSQLLEGVEESASQANEAVSSMVNKTGDVHDAMIALQRAEMALELTVQVRNKLVQAYQDVMRMPV